MKKSVVIGLSGGVDSAASALILKKQGYEVLGVFCEMHEYSAKSLNDAKMVAEQLKIDFFTLDLQEKFEKIVVRNFLDQYASGRTPNPCIICNPTVKFDGLVEFADKIGVNYIATGHYAGVKYNNITEKFAIIQSELKDQSYMLYRLRQEQLKRIIFPLFNTKKDENRLVASENGISAANNPDSQEICFIEKGIKYFDFIEQKLGKFPEGEFYLQDENKVVGKHKGLIYYTIGQRKGLNLSLNRPVYIAEIDAIDNKIVLNYDDVVNNYDIKFKDMVFQDLDDHCNKFSAQAKIRFTQNEYDCVVEIDRKNNCGSAKFSQLQRAVTKGQSIVFYDNKKVLCGGIID